MRKFQTPSQVKTAKLTEHKAIVSDLKCEIAFSELKIVYLETELRGLEAETEKAGIFQTKQGVQYMQDMRQSVFSCAS